MKFLWRLQSWPRSRALSLGAALILATSLADFAIGSRLNLTAFYVLAIFLFAWCAGRDAGLAPPAAAAVARTVVDLLGGRSATGVLPVIWNSGTRLLMFGFIALLLAATRAFVDTQRALARIDHLTGAANKRAFEEVVSVEIDRSRRYGHPFTLAYFDLDNFKSVNDSFGHVVGDRLLREVALIMRRHVRASDIVGRLGGDEFGLLLPEADESAARSAILKIHSEFVTTMGEQQWPVTVSIGSLTCHAGGLDVEQLLAKADRLMYAAKIKGKNTVQFAGPETGSGSAVAAR